MGHYTELTIGDIALSWKYQIPTFLTFLFTENELVIEHCHRQPDSDDDEDEMCDAWRETAGYRTSVAAAKSVLDGHGYTVEFLAGIYDTFRPDLHEWVRTTAREDYNWDDQCENDEEVEKRIEEYLAASVGSALDDLKAFTAFLREAIAKDLQMEPFLDREGTKAELADFESLQTLLLGTICRLPAAVLRTAALFDEGYMLDYPEVVGLIYVRLMLDATPDEAIVELNLHDIVDDEDEVRSMHTDLASELLKKLDVYQRMFRVLSSRETDVRDLYARTQIRNALAELDGPVSGKSKGDVLEDLMRAAFSIKPDLQVVQSNYLTGDEEIDLIVKNNVARPFWQNLGSSLIFVECKNWSTTVGAGEVRNFEVKLQNHAPLVRIGVLVAPNGFTREAASATKRASRGSYILTLVDRTALERLAQEGNSVIDWLEDLLCRPI
jgi:hypothetical protein